MSSNLRNYLLMFDATFLLYGGLNYVMFLFCLPFWFQHVVLFNIFCGC